MMKLCYFGSYGKDYPRSRIIIKGLKQSGIDVVECHDMSSFLYRYPKLITKFLRFAVDSDVILLGENGQGNAPLAKLITKLTGKTLIFDPFISLYDTSILDRGLYKEQSFHAKYYYFLDKLAFSLPNIIITDTYENSKYYSQSFKIPCEKFRTVYVGAEEDIFFPRFVEGDSDNFNILFYGTYIPLHGIEYIVEAAKLLKNYKDIKFTLIGYGQTYNYIQMLNKKYELKNIDFKNWVNYSDLPNYIAHSDVILGIFGGTNKALRAIPNKAFQAWAMKKPLITGKSNAMKEVATNNKNAILPCEMANSESLANAILELKHDAELGRNIAKNGYELFKEQFTPEKIGKRLRTIIEELID